MHTEENMDKRQGHVCVRHVRSAGKEITLGNSFPASLYSRLYFGSLGKMF